MRADVDGKIGCEQQLHTHTLTGTHSHHGQVRMGRESNKRICRETERERDRATAKTPYAYARHVCRVRAA